MMTFVQSAKKNLAILSLAFLLATPSAQAISLVPSTANVKNAFQTALLCAIFYSAYDFCTRKPTNDAPAYNIDELLALTNVADNLKGLWRDGVWGHAGTNNALKIDENGNITFANTTKINPKGLMGYLVHNGKSIAAAIGMTLVLKVLAETIAESSEDSFLQVLASKIEAQSKKLGFKVTLPVTPSASK